MTECFQIIQFLLKFLNLSGFAQRSQKKGPVSSISLALLVCFLLNCAQRCSGNLRNQAEEILSNIANLTEKMERRALVLKHLKHLKLTKFEEGI